MSKLDKLLARVSRLESLVNDGNFRRLLGKVSGGKLEITTKIFKREGVRIDWTIVFNKNGDPIETVLLLQEEESGEIRVIDLLAERRHRIESRSRRPSRRFGRLLRSFALHRKLPHDHVKAEPAGAQKAKRRLLEYGLGMPDA